MKLVSYQDPGSTRFFGKSRCVYRNFSNVFISFDCAGSEDKYTIYGRDPETETKLKIMNIWKNGILYWKNQKLFPNRMQNLAGRALIATSFEYSPFIYKENPEDEKFQGYEVGT